MGLKQQSSFARLSVLIISWTLLTLSVWSKREPLDCLVSNFPGNRISYHDDLITERNCLEVSYVDVRNKLQPQDRNDAKNLHNSVQKDEKDRGIICTKVPSYRFDFEKEHGMNHIREECIEKDTETDENFVLNEDNHLKYQNNGGTKELHEQDEPGTATKIVKTFRISECSNCDAQTHSVSPTFSSNETSVEFKKQQCLGETIHSKARSISDFILDMITRSCVDMGVLSQELRQLIAERTFKYLEDLYDADLALPHPKKLLHYLAPKIPAIKHSPDVLLEIKSARSDIDPGIAACLVGTLGHVCEVYESEYDSRVDSLGDDTKQSQHPHVILDEILYERRFEQLIECLLCGISVKKRRKDHSERSLTLTGDIEHLLVAEYAQYDDGLSIRDSCRAAWGIAVLGAYKLQNLGGENMKDVLIALALRCRQLLLARLQQLRQGDLYDGVVSAELSFDVRMMELSEEIAEDAATVMWTFASVRAQTNMTYHNLFDVCSSILCQEPYELRRRAQNIDASSLEQVSVGSNDIVERLALSESLDTSETSSEESKAFKKSRDCLLDYLSPKELSDVLWSVAVHGNRERLHVNEETYERDVLCVFIETAFDRSLSWLRKELNFLEQKHRFDLSDHGGNCVDQKYFNGNDLCRLVWAVTELRDPLRSTITDVILNIFFHWGQRGLKVLSVEDLSNLAWSIAKNTIEWNGPTEIDKIALIITSWISDEILARSKEETSVLKRVQPTEFSKLMWAITTVIMAHGDIDDSCLTGVTFKLGHLGLVTAAENLDLFSTADLACLSWAFIELSRLKNIFHLPSVAVALSRILARIESSLLEWEHCTLIAQKYGDHIKVDDTSNTSFLACSSFRFPFPHQYQDDINESPEESFSSSHSEKNRLPLPLDPLTLCKLSYSLERLLEKSKGCKAPKVFTITALRLFTSHNGRLLRLCPMQDLIRLCQAVALSHLSSERELISHFTRLVIHHFNVLSAERNGKRSFSLNPDDCAMLLWSLGELETKYMAPLDRNDAFSSHRKLHFIVKAPFLDHNRLLLLSNSSLKKILCGLVKIGVINEDTILELLLLLQQRVSSFTDVVDLCEIMQSLSVIKSYCDIHIDDYNAIISESKLNKSDQVNSTSLGHKYEHEQQLDRTIRNLSLEILSLITTRLTEFVPNMKLENIYEILTILTVLPFRADELVDCIESDILHRKALLEELHDTGAEQLESKYFAALSGLSGLSLQLTKPENKSSRLVELKNGQKSFLVSTDRSQRSHAAEPSLLPQGDEENSDRSNGGLEKLEQVKQALLEITSHLNAIQRTTQFSLLSAIESSKYEALFELGRCTESIIQYRRIDFSSGKKASLLDPNPMGRTTKLLWSHKRP